MAMRMTGTFTGHLLGRQSTCLVLRAELACSMDSWCLISQITMN